MTRAVSPVNVRRQMEHVGRSESRSRMRLYIAIKAQGADWSESGLEAYSIGGL